MICQNCAYGLQEYNIRYDEKPIITPIGILIYPSSMRLCICCTSSSYWNCTECSRSVMEAQFASNEKAGGSSPSESTIYS